MTDLKELSKAATASSREMATELGNRFGVEKLVDIWERHQRDVQAWAKVVNEIHREELQAAVEAEREACAAIISNFRAHLNFEALLDAMRDERMPPKAVHALSDLLDGMADLIRARSKQEGE